MAMDKDTPEPADELAEILGDLPGDPPEEEDTLTDTADEESDGEAEEAEEAEASEEEDADYDKGRWAADDARVRMPDGNYVAVSELKNGYLRQDEFSRKTQGFARERDAFEAQREQIQQAATQYRDRLDQVDHWLEQSKPQRPSVPYDMNDPETWGAWGAYREGQAQWDEASRYWQAQRQELEDKTKREDEENNRAQAQREMEALYGRIPSLRDPAKQNAFVAEAARLGAQHWGISEQDVRSIADHRLFLVLKDAMAYRRLQTRKPKAKAEIEEKPQMLRTSRRADPKVEKRRGKTERFARLNKTGSKEAGIASLLDVVD